MKKYLALVLSLILIIFSVVDGGVALAFQLPRENGLKSFSADLSNMISKYDFDTSLENEWDEYQQEIEEEFFASTSQTGNANSEIECDLPDTYFETNRLIVKSKKNIDYRNAVDCVSGYNDLFILQYSNIEDTIDAYNYYKSVNDIIYVEPDVICTSQDDVNIDIGDVEIEDVTSADQLISWASEEIGFTDIKESLKEKILPEVVVAVLDSGVDTDHELLVDRLIESDINMSSSGHDTGCEDDYGHGTHVAGIIVNNTVDNVKIKPYKVLNDSGMGSISAIAVAVDMAVADGADIINMSLTAPGESITMTNAIDNATNQDVSVIVAAGNNNKNLSKSYYTPACVESAITVSATNKFHTLSSYSNYNETIDIAAPGDDVISSYLNNTYATLSGTSMAAPQVVAGFAIVKSVYPELNAAEIESFIEEHAIKKLENEGENLYGAGILYMKYLLEEQPRTAEPVFSVESCEFSNSFTLTLSCPEDDAIILYLINEDDGTEIGFLNGSVYREPITISVDTVIVAVAITGGKKFSSVVRHQYTRVHNTDADDFDINASGQITGYFGKDIDISIPEKVQNKTVRGIAASAFQNNTDIRSVHLPKNITTIGVSAFEGCTSLESVTGEGIKTVKSKAFKNSSISDFPFEQIKTIGSYAFASCTNLPDISLNNIESIDTYAFQNATIKKELYVDTNPIIEKYAFSGSTVKNVDMPNITALGDGVFNKCSSLKSVHLESAENIGMGTFKYCTSLDDVLIPSVTTIGSNAFQNANLSSVKFDNVETVGNYAFGSNPNLERISLENATSIGACTFEYCSNLELAYFPVLKDLNANIFNDCQKLKYGYFPEVLSVNKSALETSYIEYLYFGDVQIIKSLPNTLKMVVLPESLTSITVVPSNTDFTIMGYIGSYAEEYAIQNNIEFKRILTYTVCDVNGDKVIDAADAILVMRYDEGLIELEGDFLLAADVNSDNSVDDADAQLILSYDVGLIEEF